MNTPATFDRCVTHFLRSVRDFAPSYFDDVFIHSRSVNGKSDVEMHKENPSKLLALMPKTPRRRDIRVYKWVCKYVRACEVYQRVKPATFSQAPLRSIPSPS
ncbi:hypothetical protein PR003_g14345 [Phytophthora rubi]|uniref:Reverse transcriptase domain-containing protein n=1 Tax=Phytophthora rubi TaxID=129364 RepID=A0A6A4EUV4_9STRA|nr:hypothetical protein PR002_g14036 [Phytophthora rubi]KAE9332773.1 hypothetical protein PR003_g14345 [Phytophthora rubi]